MNRRFFKLIVCSLFIFNFACVFSAEENFLLINDATDEILLQLGPHTDDQVTPSSTFKIALSLMGFDAEILKDEKNPTWDFQEGYVDYIEAWKASQTPQTWMKYSCFWYSQLLAMHLGLEKIQNYLALIDYGNQDMSGGLSKAWVSSSLKISPNEQVKFLQKLIREELPISGYAIQMTKQLLFLEDLPEGWKLYGKTGWGSTIENGEKIHVGWFVGWFNKGEVHIPFAYNTCGKEIDLSQRIPRVKQLFRSLVSQTMDEGRGGKTS